MRPEGAIRVAGHIVENPLEVLASYADRYGETTVRDYDGGGIGDPAGITLEDIKRTRVIGSRISHAEAAWFVDRGESAPWQDVPVDAVLASADPDERDGLYDAGVALFDHFRGRPGVATAKISKILHMKRPGLIPILDSHLLGTYRAAASEAARSHTNPRDHERMYWAAIRDDVMDPENAARLTSLRGELRRSNRTQPLAGLSDIRLLDIVTWKRS